MKPDIAILVKLHIGHVHHAVIVGVQKVEPVSPFILKIVHLTRKSVNIREIHTVYRQRLKISHIFGQFSGILFSETYDQNVREQDKSSDIEQ